MAAKMNERSRVLDIIFNNNIEEMRQYLKEGGNVDFVINEEMTPLAMAKSAEMAELLLDNGADIHFHGIGNLTPLLAQASPGNPQVVDLMLRRYPPDPTKPESKPITRDVNKYGNTPLHVCVIH